MKRMTLVAVTVMALFLLLTVGAPCASADTLTFQLTGDNCTGGCLPSGVTSAGTVTVEDIVANEVQVTVTLNPALGAGYGIVSTGFDTSFGFNLSGSPTITFSNVSPSADYAPNANPETAGSLHMDGAGYFEYGVNQIYGNGGGKAVSAPLVFDITGTGLSTASFLANSNDVYFAVDIFGNGNTGIVDATSAPTVPDGGITLMMLGGVLVGLETLRRRFGA